MTEDRKQELLEQAKRDYPVGTKFYPSHLRQRKEYSIVTEDTVFEWHLDHIAATIKKDRVFAYRSDKKYGNTIYNRYVCTIKNGHVRWAEILRDSRPYWDNHSAKVKEALIKVYEETTLKPGDKHYGNNRLFEERSNPKTREDLIEYIINDPSQVQLYTVEDYSTWHNLEDYQDSDINIIAGGKGSIYDDSCKFPHAITYNEVQEYIASKLDKEQGVKRELAMSLVKDHFQVGDKHFGYNEWADKSFLTRECLLEYLIKNNTSPIFHIKTDDFYSVNFNIPREGRIYSRDSSGCLYADDLPDYLRLSVTERELNQYKRNKLKAVRYAEAYGGFGKNVLIQANNSKSEEWYEQEIAKMESLMKTTGMSLISSKDKTILYSLDVAKLKLKKRKKQRKLSKQ